MRTQGPLTSVEAVIEALGGTVQVSRLCGVRHSAVSNWQSFGRFPDKVSIYRTIRDALAEGGLEVDEALFTSNGEAA